VSEFLIAFFIPVGGDLAIVIPAQAGIQNWSG
jgi:hypothetical protein